MRPPARTAEARRRAEYLGQWLRNRRTTELLDTIPTCGARGQISIGPLSEIERGLKDPYSLELRTVYKLALAYLVTPEAILRRLKILPPIETETETEED